MNPNSRNTIDTNYLIGNFAQIIKVRHRRPYDIEQMSTDIT